MGQNSHSKYVSVRTKTVMGKANRAIDKHYLTFSIKNWLKLTQMNANFQEMAVCFVNLRAASEFQFLQYGQVIIGRAKTAGGYIHGSRDDTRNSRSRANCLAVAKSTK